MVQVGTPKSLLRCIPGDGADFIDNNFSLWRRLTRGSQQQFVQGLGPLACQPSAITEQTNLPASQSSAACRPELAVCFVAGLLTVFYSIGQMG